MLLLKHGRSDIVQQAGLDDLLKNEKPGIEYALPAATTEVGGGLILVFGISVSRPEVE